MGLILPRRLSPSQLAGVAGACLAIAFVGWVYVTALLTPAYGTFHDDAVYLVTAKSLAEGNGYHITSIPGEPPQTKYPILFPWLLSLVWAVYPSFPDNLLALRAVPLTATVLWLWVSWRLLRELGTSPGLARAIVFLTAISPWVVFLATTLLSEALFAALLSAGLLAVLKCSRERSVAFEGFVAGILMGAACLTRTAGFVPALVCGFVILKRQKWSASLQYFAALAFVVGPWFAWVALSNTTAAAVDSYSSASAYAQWHILSSQFSLAEQLNVFVTNALFLGMSVQWLWWGDRLPAPLTLAGIVASWVLLGVGLWRQRRQGDLIAPVLAYSGMLLVWLWVPLRFVVPLTPVFLWLLLDAFGPRGRVYALTLACILTCGSTLRLIDSAQESRITGSFWYRAGVGDDWRGIKALLEWLSRESPADAILAGNLDPTYYLGTGRRAIRPYDTNAYELLYAVSPRFPIGSPKRFRERLLHSRVDYLVVTPSRDFSETPHFNALIDNLKSERPESLIEAYRAPLPGYVIYRVDRAALSDGNDPEGPQ